MNIFRLTPGVLVVIGVLVGTFLATPAKAVHIGDLVSGGSMIVGDKLFDQFRVTENSIGGDVTGRSEVNLSNIDVTGDNSDALNPGLIFTSLNNELRIVQAAATPTGELDLDFIFRVSTLDGKAKIKDNSLTAEFGGTAPDGGLPAFQTDHFAEVRERLFHDALLTTPVLDLINIPIEKDVHRDVDDSGGVFSDQSGLVVSKEFAELSELWVLKDFRVQTASAGELAEILSFEQHFSQVPEPTTIALLGIGLAGLAGAEVRRRRKKKAVDNA